jgi:hypothetical protein
VQEFVAILSLWQLIKRMSFCPRLWVEGLLLKVLSLTLALKTSTSRSAQLSVL